MPARTKGALTPVKTDQLTTRGAGDLVSRGLADLQALDEVVEFPDKQLEAAVREELEKPAGPLTKRDLEALETLTANGDIQDPTGLEYCVNLNELTLSGNQITDVSPLAELTGLAWLYLDRNQITDLTPLAELTGLTWLSLSWNQITDLTPLAGLTGLTWLYLDGNQITDLTPLAELTGLTWLSLDDNPLSAESARWYSNWKPAGVKDGND